MPKAQQAKADSLLDIEKRSSEKALEKAMPIIQAEALNGRPYIPWAARPTDLPQAKIPSFPGAMGGGAYSFGGRGGKVITVTSLADRGPGTLREACETGGARIVVFNVSGIIHLKSPIIVNAPYMTVAGQTAPGDGVCVAGESFWVNTHDVVVRFMRFRRGETDVTRRDDSFGGNPVGNIMIDHCSCSWGLDENISFYRHMGQNLSGFPEIIVNGKRGTTVRLTVGESLNLDGTVSQKNTGSKHYYEYTLKGGGDEYWHPRFSYYGFRYIQVEGACFKGDKANKNLPLIKKIQSCFVYNSAEDAGEFKCSNKIFNDAHRIICMAMRSNMQGVFTDCPHREKLGWLEEAHLNGPGLFFNYNLTKFIPKIMQDMCDAQHSNGLVPSIAPEYVEFEGDFQDSPEWGSASVILP